MNHEVILADHFGSRLSNGEQAFQFRIISIDPYIDMCDQVAIDFTGIRSANSSFVNALISGLFEQHGDSLFGKVVFVGCLPTIRTLLESAVSLGLTKHAGQRA